MDATETGLSPLLPATSRIEQNDAHMMPHLLLESQEFRNEDTVATIWTRLFTEIKRRIWQSRFLIKVMVGNFISLLLSTALITSQNTNYSYPGGELGDPTVMFKRP